MAFGVVGIFDEVYFETDFVLESAGNRNGKAAFKNYSGPIKLPLT